MPAERFELSPPLSNLGSVGVSFARHWLHLRRPISSATGGNHARQQRLFARLELADGTVGYGEAAPHITRGPSLDDVEAEAVGWLRNTPAGAVDETVIASAPPILQLALIDALARQRSLPAWKFLGLPEPPPFVQTLLTYGGTPAELHAQITAEHPSAIKLKLLGDEADFERIEAVTSAFAGPLSLDVNGAWPDIDSANRALARIENVLPGTCELLWIEQPCPPAALTTRLKTRIPIFADEAVTHPSFDWNVYDGIVIKPAAIRCTRPPPIRGLCNSILRLRAAAAAGKQAIFGCHLQSSLLTAATLSLAGLTNGGYHDLDAPLLIENDPCDPRIVAIHDNGNVLPPLEDFGWGTLPQSLDWATTASIPNTAKFI